MRALERERIMATGDSVEPPSSPLATGHGLRSSASIHSSFHRLVVLLHTARSRFQNVLIAASTLLIAWSFAYLAAGTGAWSLFGYRQSDTLMSLVRLVAFLATAVEGIRAGVDADRLPRVSHGWAFVPLLFTFLDIVLMTVPGSTAVFSLEGGALYLSVLNFALALVYLVLCFRAAAEHPEAAEGFRTSRQRIANAKAERINNPRPSRLPHRHRR